MKVLKTTTLLRAGLLPLLALWCTGMFAQTVATFSSAAAAASIPDGAYNGTQASMATKSLTVAIPANKLVQNIRVIVDASHDAPAGSAASDNCSGGDGTGGWVGDMTIKLFAPGGQVMGLMSRPGLTEGVDGAGTCCGNSADYLKSSPNLTFADNGTQASESMGGAGTTDGLGNINVFSYRPTKGIINSPYTTFASMIQAIACNSAQINGNWTLGMADGALFDGGCFTSWSMEVTYGDACQLVCPANSTINLDPGACSQVVNYNVTTTGTCLIAAIQNGFVNEFAPNSVDWWQTSAGGLATGAPPAFPAPGNQSALFNGVGSATTLTLQTPANGGWCYNGVEWLWTGTSSTTVDFDWSMTFGSGTNAFWDDFVFMIGSATNHLNNNNNNFCQNFTGIWQNISTPNIFSNAPQNGHFTRVITPGQSFALAVHAPIAWGGTNTVVNITNFQFGSIVPAVPVLTSGLPSGAEFPRGNNQVCYSLTYTECGVNKVQNCCFNILVLEYPNPITSLVCNDLVYVSLDENCSYCLGADGVLEGGPYGCYDDYIVEVDKTAPFGNGPWVPACFGPSDVGKTYQVRVTDPDTGNKCWGNVKIEDKVPPALTCCDYAIPCNASTAPIFGAFDSQVKASGNAPVNITDNTTVNSTANVQACTGSTINDVNVTVNITHTWIGDLTIDLVAPSGTSARLWNQNCGATDNWRVTLDDEAAVCSNLCVDYTVGNTLRPIACLNIAGVDFLDVFDGEDPNGQWRLQVRDGFGGDQGTIDSWSVVLAITTPNGTVPEVFEGCCFDNLTYIDTEVDGSCANGLDKTIRRKWTASDCSGNTSTCLQLINLVLPTLDDITLPPDYDDIDAPAFDCTDNIPHVNGHPNPTPDWIEGQGLQGYPWYAGLPSGCTINWEYHDYPIEVCDGTVKYRREWTVIDWCIGDGFIYNQIIKVLDDQGPEIVCPANITVSVDPFSCCATTNLPDVIVEDNCSRINNISGMIVVRDAYTNDVINMVPIGGSLQDFPGNNHWDLDTLANFGWTPCLPLGTHTVTYVAEDDCGNTTQCNFNLTVRDYIPPVAACDETTTVAIGVDDPFDCYGPAGPSDQPPALDACNFAGVTWVKATTFDDGSYDNCSAVKFTIRRMAPYSDCILGLNATNGYLPCDDIFPDFPSEFERAISEQDSIKFYCCEVGTTQTVILRVYQLDVNGNFAIGPDGSPIYNECMIQVEVQDKIKPVCLPPANVTVDCENFDPSLWAYGKAQVADNCCLDTSKVYQGQCGLTHSVSYAQFDTVCNKGTITRTFRAFDCHGFSSQCTQRVIVRYLQDYYIKFPDDQVVNQCNGAGNYGEPSFFGEDCELLGVSYEDEIFTVVPDACFKIERTWTIINWCTYDPNLDCIYVPNPNPNPQVNHASNRPGPTVSACGTLPPWKSTVVKINPTDPVATDYCTFWDANANCYKYKQIIKIIDNEAPTGTYTVPDCSNQNWFTPNNPQLWNEMYWWDNTIGTHDLCEEPTDLCITGTDACSGANINIEYLLFLDLDGDGIMETVVNSVNVGLAGLGWNTVLYNNLNTPNYGGGTPRAFDERPVPGNQKYGFAIQETVSGTNKTACVRWNTQQQQNTYVVPELPHGTHKIKWFITDGCGNNKEYEYTFTVKDCKAPTVVCLNGLSVNIMPTGMITLWASDFLQYTEDNCTPAGQLKIGIRKCGEGTGFPTNPDGTPQTSVTFTCDDEGLTKCVELWSIDAAGNADYCETYVIIQDNLGNCGGNGTINVSGALKTEMQDGVEEGMVNIDGTSNFAPPFSYFDLSDVNGAYAVGGNVPVASTFTIAPEKDDNPLNGVTTYDLVLISKHILGTEPLNSPYKMIAADANKSGSITTFDIVEIRKLILGIYTELPNNTSWRFVDKAFAFPNANNPFQTSFPEVKSVADAMANQIDEDFVGVKVGDVNNTAAANLNMPTEERTTGTALFDLQDRVVKAGEEFDVTFKSAEQLNGFQFTATLNGLTAVGAVEAENVNSTNFNMTQKGLVAVSIDGAQGFTLRLRADRDGRLSEMLGVSGAITRAEAYGQEGRKAVAFRFDGKTIAGVGFELYQNVPNPFVSKTFIGFNLPEAAEATLTILDETGRVVYQQKGQFAKGENAIQLDRALINTTGMLYYKLETATDSATRKMIQAK